MNFGEFDLKIIGAAILITAGVGVGLRSKAEPTQLGKMLTELKNAEQIFCRGLMNSRKTLDEMISEIADKSKLTRKAWVIIIELRGGGASMEDAFLWATDILETADPIVRKRMLEIYRAISVGGLKEQTTALGELDARLQADISNAIEKEKKEGRIRLILPIAISMAVALLVM